MSNRTPHKSKIQLQPNNSSKKRHKKPKSVEDNPGIGQKILNSATKLSIRILPKEVQHLLTKYKKWRNGGRKGKILAKNQNNKGATTTILIMPPKSKKGSKTSNQAQNQAAPTSSNFETLAEVSSVPPPPSASASVEIEEDALIQKLKRMSIEEEVNDMEVAKGSKGGNKGQKASAKKNEAPKNATPPISSPKKNETSKNEEDFANNKERFIVYNRRLADIVNFRESLAKLKASTAIPEQFRKAMEEVETMSKDDVQKARDAAAQAEIKAQDLQDKVDELTRANNGLNDRINITLIELDEQKKENVMLRKDLNDTQSKLEDETKKLQTVLISLDENKQLMDDLKKKHADERAARINLEQALEKAKDDAKRDVRLKEGETMQKEETYLRAIEQKEDEIESIREQLAQIQHNYNEALHQKRDELEEIYNRRRDQNAQQLEDLKNALRNKENELESIKTESSETTAEFRKLQQENNALKAKLDDVEKDLDEQKKLVKNKDEKISEITTIVDKLDKDLRDTEAKMVIEDLHPEFKAYDGLLIIEEKRIQSVKDVNNNAEV